MVDSEGEFVPPPEAPVFEPTWEEFQDALGYIAKIRPIAEKSGICKVRPPPDWQPPFAVDVDLFRFTPRVQRLNELEAKTRIKLNFLDQLAKFWELQGSPLRIPLVERKYLDLYLLQKTVTEEGGYEITCKERKWAKVTSRLGYAGGKGVGSTLRHHYEKILYPFDIFQSGIFEADKMRAEELNGTKVEVKPEIKEELPSDMSAQKENGAEGMTARRSKRIAKEELKHDPNLNSELRKLQFYGAGPKMALPDALDKEEELEETEATTVASKKGRMKTRDKKNVSYVDMYMCHMCNRGDGEEHMLLCDGCDDAFHTYCLIPPLADIPAGDWRCPRCVAKACTTPKTAYGFEQAKKEYTLQTYGEMADQFKLDYFNMPVHLVPCSTVEREFWRLVNCIEEDVVIEYGADIHAIEYGSGFPTTENKELPEDEEYVHSGWNLNNLPILEQSVLKYIGGDISGMKVPWCYVGMCFSSFCWHTEDHWSYSINYLHWGEPKTWYGVPGAKAELLEECMKKNAPELFEQSPDLLHQLTTIMNPNTLMAYGVPVVRTNQCAGEFIITFPRAYHAGFNQGYNFAEAVNFCPADWISKGHECVQHYQMLKRQCVFSHEELICKMATYPERIDLNMAAAVHQDMLAMVEEEKECRKKLLNMGISEAEREAFELLADDERQCYICKTTCFLSAITCSCSLSKIVCVRHARELCDCSAAQKCLRYRYTLDELPAMLHRLKIRAESFDNWAYQVKRVLEAEGKDKVDLNELRELWNEAKDKKFPDSPLLEALIDCVSEAEKCSTVASQLLSHKVRTRNRQSGDSKYVAKLSLEELQCFSEQIHSLACVIKEAEQIKALVDQVESFQTDAQEALAEVVPNSAKLQTLMDTGVTLDVDLPEIPKLKQLLHQAHWLDEVDASMKHNNQLTLETMRKLLEAGVALAPHPTCERAMAELQEVLTVSERFEEKARQALQAKPRLSIAMLENILSDTGNIPAELPNVTQLRDAVRRAKEWVDRVVAIQTGEHYPYLDTLEAVVNKGRPIPVRLDQLAPMEAQVGSAKSWRDRTARTFLKKNSTANLVEILSPRNNIGLPSGKLKKRKLVREGSGERDIREVHMIGDIKVDETRDPATIVAAFKVAEAQEVTAMRDLRNKNMQRYKDEGINGKYCLCHRSPSGLMLQCELCKDWYHSTCVPLPKSANLKSSKASPAVLAQAARDLKFLCPLCLRSRRPRLETILSLLVSLQKLPVRMPEGEALQCLTERAMAWQDTARQALATEELSSALAKLSMLSQRMVEAAAREKTEKIISAEIMKAASNNPELHSQLPPPGSASEGGLGNQGSDNNNDPSVGIMADDLDLVDPDDNPLQIVVDKEVEAPHTPTHSGFGDLVMDDELQSANPMPSEHAYSTVSKPSPGMSPKKTVKKSPGPVNGTGASQQPLDPSVLRLSPEAQCQLEELMMEGDLLEVSLDETQHIWKILQSCTPNASSRILHIKNASGDGSLLNSEKKKKRKKEVPEGSDGTTPAAGVTADGETKPKKKKKKKIVLPDGTEKFVKDLGDKKPKEGEKKKRKRNVKKDLNTLMVDNDDAGEDCSALKCLKPHGEEVNWVQCDGCELWFHLLCVGLAEDEVSENEDYICFKCSKVKSGEAPRPLDDMLSAASLALDETRAQSQPVRSLTLKPSTSGTTPTKSQQGMTTPKPKVKKRTTEKATKLVPGDVKAPKPRSPVVRPMPTMMHPDALLSSSTSSLHQEDYSPDEDTTPSVQPMALDVVPTPEQSLLPATEQAVNLTSNSVSQSVPPQQADVKDRFSLESDPSATSQSSEISAPPVAIDIATTHSLGAGDSSLSSVKEAPRSSEDSLAVKAPEATKESVMEVDDDDDELELISIEQPPASSDRLPPEAVPSALPQEIDHVSEEEFDLSDPKSSSSSSQAAQIADSQSSALCEENKAESAESLDNVAL